MDEDGLIMMGEILNVTRGQDGEAMGVNIELAVYRPAPTKPPPKKRRARRKSRQKIHDIPKQQRLGAVLLLSQFAFAIRHALGFLYASSCQYPS